MCQKIPWPSKGPITNAVLKEGNPYALGTFAEVRSRRNCPFCRLVVSSEMDVPGPPRQTNDAEEVLVRWDESRGFRVDGTITPQGTRVCFAQKQDSRHSHLNHARVVHGTSISISKVENWLCFCQKNHGDVCSRPPSPGRRKGSSSTIPVRVIDVNRQCIVIVEGNCRYLTLSYVWGQVTPLRLVKQNRESLMASNGLEMVRKHIPRTITDAMDLVSMLGERYLWVDTLCLIQDNEKDVIDGIQTMDQVYEGALVTIIAGSGLDASSGLPGVQPNSRNSKQLVENIEPGVKMTVVHELDDYMKHSRYDTRAWMYVF